MRRTISLFTKGRLLTEMCVALAVAGGLAAALLLANIQPGSGYAGDARRGSGMVTVIEATTITTDTIWTAAGNPYEILGLVWIQAPATLTIEKGVHIVFEGPGDMDYSTGGSIRGQGNLAIRGAPDERVVVEGPPPSVVGGGPPLGIQVEGVQDVQYADLRSISIRGCEPFEWIISCPVDSPVVSFDHVNFLETFFDFRVAHVRVVNSVLSRAYVTIIQSGGGEITGNLIWLTQGLPQSGAYSYRGALEINHGRVMSNTIIYNGNGGVYSPYGYSIDLPLTPKLTFTGNNIYGNAEWDFYRWTGLTDPFSAPNNWWGTTDIAAIQSRIVGNVDVLPIATAPIPGAPRLHAAYFPLVMAGASSW